MSTPEAGSAAILVAADNFTDAALVKKHLADEFDQVFITIEGDKAADLARDTPIAKLRQVLAGAIAGNLLTERNSLIRQERERLTIQAGIVERNVAPQLLLANHVIEGILRELPSWRVRKDGFKRANRQLQVINDTLIGIRPILVLRADGQVVASGNETLIGMNFAQRDYFKTAVASPDPGMLHVSASFKTVAMAHCCFSTWPSPIC